MFLVTIVFEVPNGSSSILILYHLFVLILCSAFILLYRTSLNIDSGILFRVVALMIFFLCFSFINTKSSLLYVALLSIVFSYCIILITVYKENRYVFFHSLNIVISINVFFLFLQYLLINFMEINVNFHEALFPFSQGHTYQLKGIEFVRITGLYNEPGTYSTWMSIMVALSMLMSKKISALHLISMISVAITFSATGFVFFILFVSMFVYIHSKSITFKKLVLALLFIFISVFIMSYIGIIEYIGWRFLDDNVVDGTTQSKFSALRFLIDASETRQIFGSGLANNDCPNCDSIQDVGLAFNFIFYFGFFSLFLFIIIVSFIKKINTFSVYLIILCLTSKMFIFSPILWLSLFLVYSKYSYKEYKVDRNV